MSSKFDSFDESVMHEFIESPLHERNADGREGNLFFGGSFTKLNPFPGDAISQLGVFNEEDDKWDALQGGGVDSRVNDLCVYKDELIAVGNFTNNEAATVPNVALNRIGRYSKKDFLWRDLGGVGNFNREITNCFVWRDGSTSGKLIVSGTFSKAGGSVGNGIAQWDGNVWSDLGGGIVFGGARQIHNMGQFEGNLIAVGLFFTIGGFNIKSVAKWNGNQWKALDDVNQREPNGPAFGVFGDRGNLYIGGNFGSFSNGGPATDVNGAAFWDGKDWNIMEQGFDPPPPGGMAPGDVSRFRNDLIYSGEFTKASDATANNIAKWNGSSWSALDAGTNSNLSLGQHAIFKGQLVVTGRFTTVGSAPLTARGIARWNGVAWSDLNEGITLFDGGNGRGVVVYEST